MKSPEPIRPATYLIALLALGLASATALQGLRGSQAASILNTSARASNLPRVPQLFSDPIDLDVIARQALFYATRTEYQPPPQSTVPAQVQLSNYQLIGTLIAPHKPSIAFLRNRTTKALTTATAGTHFGRWVVTGVHNGRVVFRLGSQQTTLATAEHGSLPSAVLSQGVIRMPIVPHGVLQTPTGLIPRHFSSPAHPPQ